MNITKNERALLRKLGGKVAEIAALPINQQRRSMWQRLNGLKPVKPLIFVYEIPWHEMNYNDELTLRCTGDIGRQLEWKLRETIYRWEHLQGDMVVEPVVYSPLVIQNSGFGISEQVDTIKTDDHDGSVVSRHFHIQIQNEEDIAKIQMPVVTHNKAASLAATKCPTMVHYRFSRRRRFRPRFASTT